MSDTITKEMDELERVKQAHQYRARITELKIQRIKLHQNLQKIDEEEVKLQDHLKRLEES